MSTLLRQSKLRSSAVAVTLLDRDHSIFALALGIKVVSYGDRKEAQRRWVKQFFEREVRPLLIPRPMARCAGHDERRGA